MSPITRFDHAGFDLDALVEAKADRTVSLCLPARDEAATIGLIVEAVRDHPLLDEVVVVDDHSSDATAAVAAAAGARVVEASTTLAAYGSGPGKGQALWKATAMARGELLVFCDADLRDFSTHYLVGLLGPLLSDARVGYVKAFYDRPGDGHPRGGGRVTELVARPLLHLLFPSLRDMVQPLAGEFAARRDVLEAIPFVEGYGVDIAMLIDVAAAFGVGCMAQVDLGIRLHRNRPLPELGPMATVVLMAALSRFGVEGMAHEVQIEHPEMPVVPVRLAELPPLVDIAEYRAR